MTKKIWNWDSWWLEFWS